MTRSIRHRQQGGRRASLAAFAAAIAAALAPSAAARAEDPPGGEAQPATAAKSAPTTSAAVAPETAPPATSATAPGEAGPVARAHHRYAERPSLVAFNPSRLRVTWDDGWPKFRLAEYVTTGAAGVLVFASQAIPPQPANWRDVSSFDAGARDALRLRTLSARNTADDTSDLILTLLVNQLVVDATLVAWWGHDRPSVGYQMVLIDLEALALTGSLQAIVSAAVSRWRPFRDTCVGPVSSQTRDCQENKQYTSFWSGHTSGAFTAAGLMCMHHLHIPLYGGGAPEVITCAASFAAAATVGYLRIAADQHFMTDVLVGAAIGTMSGLGIPWLLHYRGAKAAESEGGKRAGQASIRIAPGPLSLAVQGEF